MLVTTITPALTTRKRNRSLTLRPGSPNEAIPRCSFLRRNATSADTTAQLASKPDSAFEPLTLKPLEDSFSCTAAASQPQGSSDQGRAAADVQTDANREKGCRWLLIEQINGVNDIAAKQAGQITRKFAVDPGSGLLVVKFVTYQYGHRQEAKNVADAVVEHAASSPKPAVKDLWSDIYSRGTKPEMIRGPEEFHIY
ncbi:hypothetical protein BKA70DRAFT_1558923 [Coprinopsis sp. MPI-PUGE-AT-0042]|nr:hypothetical protein BKA70DRAFT_1558923 [Coprinopsis sp. MPI-PUGE-AT-0042]